MRLTQCLFRSVESHWFIFNGLLMSFIIYCKSQRRYVLSISSHWSRCPNWHGGFQLLKHHVWCHCNSFKASSLSSSLHTLAGHVPLPNPVLKSNLCWSQEVPIISKRILCFRNWIILSLTELLLLLLLPTYILVALYPDSAVSWRDFSEFSAAMKV